MDNVCAAHRTWLMRLGPLTILFYRLLPTQFHPRQRLRIKLHFQWGPQCMEMAL